MVPGLCEPAWSPSWSWKPPVITSTTAKDFSNNRAFKSLGSLKRIGHGCKHSSSKLHFVQPASGHTFSDLLQLVEEVWGEETKEAPEKLGNKDWGDSRGKRHRANSISLICMVTASQVRSQSCEKDQLIYQSAPLSAITYFPLANKKCVHYQAGPCPPKQPMRLYNYTSFLDNLHDCFPNSILLR